MLFSSRSFPRHFMALQNSRANKCASQPELREQLLFSWPIISFVASCCCLRPIPLHPWPLGLGQMYAGCQQTAQHLSNGLSVPFAGLAALLSIRLHQRHIFFLQFRNCHKCHALGHILGSSWNYFVCGHMANPFPFISHTQTGRPLNGQRTKFQGLFDAIQFEFETGVSFCPENASRLFARFLPHFCMLQKPAEKGLRISTSASCHPPPSPSFHPFQCLFCPNSCWHSRGLILCGSVGKWSSQPAQILWLKKVESIYEKGHESGKACTHKQRSRATQHSRCPQLPFHVPSCQLPPLIGWWLPWHPAEQLAGRGRPTAHELSSRPLFLLWVWANRQ